MMDYLLRSAKKGYSPALVKYAYYLENGIYVEKDYQMAYEYYLSACQKPCNIINKPVIIIIQKQVLCLVICIIMVMEHLKI